MVKSKSMKNEDFKPHFPSEIITEGKAKVVVPKLKAFVKSPSEYAPSKAPVFYNPVMEFNRDLSILAMQAYQRGLDREITVCDPLTAGGVRGIRYALEVKGVRKVCVNDINENAFQLAKHNVALNKLGKRITVRNEDANLFLSKHSAPHKRFDAIDVDPFGSPVPYLDSAIRALRKGGLLALTATDMAPLCGVHPKACIRKYGGKPLRTEYCHELAIRLLAGCLASVAAKRDIGINVVFSHRLEHYVRLYATISYGAKAGDESIKQMGYILHCFKCFHREPAEGFFNIGQSLACRECNSKLSVAGPLWLGRIFDKQFVEVMEQETGRRVLSNGERTGKILSLIENETEAPITYYVVDKICDVLRLPVPSVKNVIEGLREDGYSACLTHFNSRGIRSNAPAAEICKVVRRTADSH
jgi:tRNA (guanine26-N2/guanine27-N2)-dimethyltransferase